MRDSLARHTAFVSRVVPHTRFPSQRVASIANASGIRVLNVKNGQREAPAYGDTEAVVQ